MSEEAANNLLKVIADAEKAGENGEKVCRPYICGSRIIAATSA